jgi:DnaJ-class molecular chaperone
MTTPETVSHRRLRQLERAFVAGVLPEQGGMSCLHCHGEGSLRQRESNGQRYWVPCKDCKGIGYVK